MSFAVTIDQFEGPLDLMLHLIRENKLELFDLNITILTEQYLMYLEQMEKMQLEIASEYLLELATLVEYKSKKLLPKETAELEGEFEEDPKERLIRRLLEYQQFKEVSQQLEQLFMQRQKQLTKPMSMQADEWIGHTEPLHAKGTPYELVKAMQKCIRRMRLMQPLDIKYTAKEISVEDRILQIKARWLGLPEVFSFEQLLDDCPDLHAMIVTFLAILDMARTKDLVFTIDETEQIWLKRGSR